MFYPMRARPARLKGASIAGRAGLKVPDLDLSLAPVVFCWHAYTASGRESKYFHFITLDRLQVWNGPGGLMRSPHFGLPSDELRSQLQARASALLPNLPEGYTWLGPQLVHNTTTDEASAKLARGDKSPMQLSPLVQAVQPLARKILRELETA